MMKSISRINYTKSIKPLKQKILKFFILIRSIGWETFKAKESSWEASSSQEHPRTQGSLSLIESRESLLQVLRRVRVQ